MAYFTRQDLFVPAVPPLPSRPYNERWFHQQYQPVANPRHGSKRRPEPPVQYAQPLPTLTTLTTAERGMSNGELRVESKPRSHRVRNVQYPEETSGPATAMADPSTQRRTYATNPAITGPPRQSPSHHYKPVAANPPAPSVSGRSTRQPRYNQQQSQYQSQDQTPNQTQIRSENTHQTSPSPSRHTTPHRDSSTTRPLYEQRDAEIIAQRAAERVGKDLKQLRSERHERDAKYEKMKSGYEAIKEKSEKFENELEEEINCPICSSVMIDPVLLAPCGHGLCAPCAVNWLHAKAEEGQDVTCPICREKLSGQVPLIANRPLEHAITKWVESKMNTIGQDAAWDGYEDYLERQESWNAYTQVNPNRLEEDLFPRRPASQQGRRAVSDPMFDPASLFEHHAGLPGVRFGSAHIGHPFHQEFMGHDGGMWTDLLFDRGRGSGDRPGGGFEGTTRNSDEVGRDRERERSERAAARTARERDGWVNHGFEDFAIPEDVFTHMPFHPPRRSARDALEFHRELFLDPFRLLGLTFDDRGRRARGR